MAHQTCILLSLVLFPILISALSNCRGPCQTGDDCSGQLTCINGRCNDDPEVGTHICSSGGSPPPNPPSGGGGCQPFGSLTCSTGTYPKYSCSPPVTASTRAILSNNNFAEGGDGGGESECDEKFHPNERVVALSTGWYAGANGRTATAKVVDECDSRNGCDAEHAGQPPCHNNIVDASDLVWNDLGLNTDVGLVPVTWSMA
ncbi:hypothetical protein ACHQM5_012869 [Ranunculus cassubicifolius]